MPIVLHATAEAAVTLGSWPDWVAAVGTSLAFLIAAVSYFRSTRNGREAQARLVYSTFLDIKTYEAGEEAPIMLPGAKIAGGEGMVIVPSPPGVESRSKAIAPVIRAAVRVHNGSDELMGPAKIQLYDTGHKKLFDRVTMFTGPIEPHSDYVVDLSIINEIHPNQPSLGMVTIFRDSSNRWWKRHQSEAIERIHDDPNNMSDSAAERAGRERNLKMAGLPGLDPEPKPPLRVRLHRLWRQVRGKTPIP